MKMLLTSLMSVGLSASALAANPVSLTWMLSGNDADGHRATERLVIAPDGDVRWNTDAVAPGCSPRGGIFGGKIDSARLDSLAALARAVVDEEKGKPGRPAESGIIVTSLELTTGTNAFVVQMTENTNPWRELAAALDKVRRETKPISAVELSARRTKGGLEASFELLGDYAIRIILPEEADQVFFKNGDELEYVNASGKMTEVTLTSKSRRHVVRLHEVGAQKSDTLAYRNEVVAHHAKLAEKGRRGLDPLSLCVRLPKP